MLGSFGTLGFGVATVAAALAMYASGATVSAERQAVEDLEVQIEADQQAIESLRAEHGVRASLSRLERINTQVWSLQAPQGDQILRSSAQLAAYLAPEEPEAQLFLASADGVPAETARAAARTQQAAAEAPVARVAAGAPARVILASAELPKPVQSLRASPVHAPKAAPPTAVLKLREEPSQAPRIADDLLSDSFLAEVEAAATLEQASFTGTALR